MNAMAKRTFAVGERVTVLYRDRVVAVRTVRRVAKRFVELSNGDKYQPDGAYTYPRPGDTWEGHRYLRHTQPGDVECIRKTRLVRALRSVDWEPLELGVLRQVAELVGVAEAEKGGQGGNGGR